MVCLHINAKGLYFIIILKRHKQGVCMLNKLITHQCQSLELISYCCGQIKRLNWMYIMKEILTN